jgi:hypothetical protein
MKHLIIPGVPLLMLASISWGGLVGSVPAPVAATLHALGCTLPALLIVFALMFLLRADRH